MLLLSISICALTTWARENECPLVARSYSGGWGIRVCHLAAAGGHLEVLIWAREHGCPWEEEEPGEYDDLVWTPYCCALAAEGGHLEVLRWLRFGSTIACPWDGDDLCERRCGQAP